MHLYSFRLLPRIDLSLPASLQNAIMMKLLENFMEIIAPSFDKSSREMFLQLSEGFSRGIENYLKKYEITISKTTAASNLESMVKEITFALQNLS